MADVLTHIDTLDVEVAPQEELDVTVGSPMEHSRVLSITKNGKYVVSEYDLADVNVSPVDAIDYYWIMPHNYGVPQINYSDNTTTLEIKFRLKNTLNQSIYDDGYTSLIYKDNQYKARLNGGVWKETLIRETDAPEIRVVKLIGTKLQIGYYLFDLKDGGHQWSYGQQMYIGKGENVGDIDIYYCKLYWDKGDFVDYEPFIENGETVLKDAVSGNVLSIEKVTKQTKSVSITENGTTSVFPDKGSVLSKVDIDVAVPDLFGFDGIGYDGTEQSIKDGVVYAKQIYDNWDPSITDMTNKFANDKKLVYVPQVDTSNVANMYYTFKNCTALTTVPLLDTSKVTNMGQMLSGCTSLQSVPQFDTSNTTFMYGMFYSSSNLNTIPLLDASKAYNINIMFGACDSLTNFGGLLNIGQGCASTFEYNLAVCAKLTDESIQNVIDGLYDMTAKGFSPTLKLHSTVYAKLTDAQKQQITAKNWTVTA